MFIGSTVSGPRPHGVARPSGRRSLVAVAALTVVGLLATSAATAAAATTRNVTATGADTGNCSVTACATIGYAVGQSVAGDTIVVGPGTFAGGTTIDKSLTLEGAKAGVDARTRGVSNTNGETVWQSDIHITANDVTIDGFTISPPFDENSFTYATTYGLKLDGTTPRSNLTIVNNVLAHNRMALHASEPSALSNVTISRNVIARNNVNTDETGLWMSGNTETNVVISDNKFANNAGADGGETAINLGGADDANKDTNVQITGNTSTNDGSFVVLLNADGVTISGNTSSEQDGTTVFIAKGTSNTTIADNSFDQGEFSGIGFSNAFGGPAQTSGVSILRNSITQMGTRAISVGADAYTGSLEAHGNRFFGNAAAVRNVDTDTTLNATNNWWGCNGGPGQPGCDIVAPDSTGALSSTPWLVLGLTALPASITAGGGASQLVADLTHNSAAGTPGVGFPNGTDVGFATTLGSIMSPGATSNGTAGSTLTAGSQTGTANVSATLDNQSVSTPVTINPPATTPTPPPAGGTAGQVAGSKKKCKKKSKKKGAAAAKKCKRK